MRLLENENKGFVGNILNNIKESNKEKIKEAVDELGNFTGTVAEFKTLCDEAVDQSGEEILSDNVKAFLDTLDKDTKITVKNLDLKANWMIGDTLEIKLANGAIITVK